MESLPIQPFTLVEETDIQKYLEYNHWEWRYREYREN